MHIITSEPIWLMEAMNLCYLKVNQQKKTRLFLDKSSHNTFYDEICQHIKNVFEQIQVTDKMEDYFRSYQPETCLANILLYSYFDFEELHRPDVKEEWKKRLQEAFSFHYADEPMSYFGLELSLKESGDLWQWLETHELEEPLKYHLIKALYKSEQTVDELWEILQDVIVLLKKEIPSYAALSQEFYQVFEKYRTDLNVFFQNHQLQWNQNVYFVISLVNYGVVWYNAREYFSQSLNVFYGIGVDFEYAMNPQRFLSSLQSEFLKAIADPSKYAILQLLKKKSMYGQELADKMKLKTPTISYHMETLIQIGIVSIQKKNNRIYYHLLPEVLMNYLDQIKEAFML